MNNPSLLFTYNASATIRVSSALCNPFRFCIVIQHVAHKAKVLFLFRFSKYPIWIYRLQQAHSGSKISFFFPHTDQLRWHGQTSPNYLPYSYEDLWLFLTISSQLVPKQLIKLHYAYISISYISQISPSNIKVLNKTTSQLVNYVVLFTHQTYIQCSFAWLCDTLN